MKLKFNSHTENIDVIVWIKMVNNCWEDWREQEGYSELSNHLEISENDFAIFGDWVEKNYNMSFVGHETILVRDTDKYLAFRFKYE